MEMNVQLYASAVLAPENGHRCPKTCFNAVENTKIPVSVVQVVTIS
jgi:hypothetical protein